MPVEDMNPSAAPPAAPTPETHSAEAPAATPAPASEPTEVSDVGWVDSLGDFGYQPNSAPRLNPPAEPAPAPAAPQYPAYGNQPAPAYGGGYYPMQPQVQPPAYYPPPAAPPVFVDPRLSPEQRRTAIVNAIVDNPEGFADWLSQRSKPDMAPVMEMMQGVMQEVTSERVTRARQESLDRLRQTARSSPDLQDQGIRQAVANAYNNLTRQAAQGNKEALNTLRNPYLPALAITLARAQQSTVPAVNRPISYAGAPPDPRSTASPNAGGEYRMTPEEFEFARKWNISPEQWVKNELENRRYDTE